MDKFYFCVFLTMVTYMTSFHASDQAHFYTRKQVSKNITAKDLLKIIEGQSSNIAEDTLYIVQKYAKRFFLNEGYETSLFFDSLQVKTLNCTSSSLLSFESVLGNFRYAFITVFKIGQILLRQLSRY